MTSKKYTFKDFLRECKEALKELWIKIWGEDLPKDMTKLYPDEEYTTAEQFNLYEQDKKKLAKKRRTAIIVILILSLISFNVIKDKIKYFIENNPTIACWNKPVCIYKGAKHIYPTSNYDFISSIDKDNIILGTTSYTAFPKWFEKKKPNQVYDYVFEIYNIKKGKMKKLNVKRKMSSSISSRYSNIDDNVNFLQEENKIIFLPKSFFKNNNKNLDVEVYDIKTKTSTINKIKTDENRPYLLIDTMNNGLLLITNYSDPYYYKDVLGYFKINKKQDEHLYFLNFSTLTIEPFPDFEVQPKIFPYRYDVIYNLNYGKKVIPIRDCRYRDNLKVFTCNWDHIEIYDSIRNKFYAELRPNIFKSLEKNLLYIPLDDGNTLFINQDDSLIFNNKTNKFENVTDKKFLKENKDFVKKISKEFSDTFKNDIFYPYFRSLNVSKLNNYQFIITIKYGSDLKSTNNVLKTNEKLNKFIFIDYKNKFIKSFSEKKNLNLSFSSKYIKNYNSKNFIFAGTTLPVTHGFANKNIFIIKVNDKKFRKD